MLILLASGRTHKSSLINDVSLTPWLGVMVVALLLLGWLISFLSGATTYRVFLLASTLQVDIAFAPATEFGPTAPTFSLLFGTAVGEPVSPLPASAALIGMGLAVRPACLHARSSIALDPSSAHGV